jgi:hypothetical protein
MKKLLLIAALLIATITAVGQESTIVKSTSFKLAEFNINATDPIIWKNDDSKIVIDTKKGEETFTIYKTNIKLKYKVIDIYKIQVKNGIEEVWYNGTDSNNNECKVIIQFLNSDTIAVGVIYNDGLAYKYIAKLDSI